MADIKNKIINMKVISKLQPHVRLDTSGSLFKIYQPGYTNPYGLQGGIRNIIVHKTLHVLLFYIKKFWKY